MNSLALQQDASGKRPSSGLDRNVLHHFEEFGRIAVCHGSEERCPYLAREGAHVGAAEPSRQFQQRLQDRLQIEGRATDDFEHVGGGGLLLQRLAELTGARLHLVEQPHVLDRDHRLVGEGGDQLDLLVGEWPYAVPAAGRSHRSEFPRAAAVRRDSVRKPPSLCASPKLIFRVGQNIRDMDGFAF